MDRSAQNRKHRAGGIARGIAMARENIDTEPVPDDLEGVRSYLARMRADFDAHNHDGANSRGFQTMKSETLTSRTIAMRKTAYASSAAGFWVGLVGATVKFDLGDVTNYLRWDGAALTITAAITGGSITGATITGGTIRTAASGQRIEITASDNLMHVYDVSSEVIKLGTASATAVTITLNANNTDGIKIISATDATLGIRMDSSSNVTFNALRIALTNTGSGNDGFGIYVENDGGSTSSYCIDVLKATTGTAIRVTNNGTGASLSLNQNNSAGTYVLEIYQNHASGSADVVHIDNIGTGIGLNILNDTAGANYALSILHASDGVASVFLDKNASGAVIDIDQDVNNAAACYGITMNLANAGAGLEYAFDFQGFEIVAAGVGATTDKKIRARIGATDYFIPCYTS